MVRKRNAELETWMKEHGLSAGALAEQVNDAMADLNGHRGVVTERTVYRWLSGENRSPQDRQWHALEVVSGLPATDLGFVPRARPRPATPSARLEDPVLGRRSFISVATGAAVAVSTGTATAATRPTVGHSDVDRLRGLLAELWLLDDQNGGGPVLEKRAADLAARTLSLQQHGSASQRVRSRLYAVAASFTAFAMFSAIDARRLGEAQRYLEQSVTLAGLSGDGQVQHQTWRYAAMLAGQRGRYADALAAAEACTGTRAHRTDPLYASLTHSRIALTAASLGDKTRALRALDRAHGAYDRADPAEARPSSVAFYTRGELHGLTGITHYRLGEAEKAEFHAHRCIADLRDDQHRNRAYYLSQAALAQVAQGDVEQAVATATRVIAPTDADAGRVPHLLGSFTSALNQAAPKSAVTRQWNDRTRTA
ncbi:Tat pathway signal protein [Streptomyces sp. NPDC029216]|uniref:Tat pathway signal protein n=1 Tax=Streptomyces sp. NPDC029216 TaxID=3154701 RepID=UPI0033FFED06